MKFLMMVLVVVLAACSGDESNNGNNRNNANNASNNVNNANNRNNTNNLNTNNDMMDPNNMMSNTNQDLADFISDAAPGLCAYDQSCDNPDFADATACEEDLAAFADELTSCDSLDTARAAMCLTDLVGLVCVNDYENYPASCDEAISYTPCEEECVDDEVFVTDRGDGFGGCFEPCENDTCVALGETCIEGGCAYIECEDDVDCPGTTCDLDQFVCVE